MAYKQGSNTQGKSTRMTRLDGQKLRRLIRIHSIGEVEVTLSADGLHFRVPGSRHGTTVGWSRVVESSYTPATAKSYLMDRPVEYLQAAARSVEQRREARIGV